MNTADLYGKQYQTSRSRLLAKHGNACGRCGLHTPFLQAHHLHYQDHHNLIFLCQGCHYIADVIRKLGFPVLEKSASANWHRFKEWMNETQPQGWMPFGEWELVTVFYQVFLLTRTKLTGQDVMEATRL